MQPDLTVFVGENNGGKSNLVDAIRLLTLPLSGRRERYPEEDDLRRGSTEKEFRIEGQFCGLSDNQKGLFVVAVPDPATDLAILGMRYHGDAQTKSLRGKTTFWAGRFDTAEPESGSLDLVRHVYLPPLRDAQHALGSGSATRINALLYHFLEDNEEQDFLSSVRRPDEPPRVIRAVNEQIGTTLQNLTGGIRPQNASLGFSDEDLFDVARDLRFKLADSGLNLQEIRSSGLGYANLLYVATVVVELAKARDADLTIFLVEEPEAHLHPQLQMLVLEFLLDQAKRSIHQQSQPGLPEGRIQIILTTHSPNLTAWVSPKHLVVVRSQLDDAASPPVHKTAAVPVAELGLFPATLRKVSRYLDVTRSALLFGNRALLVEGIAEALLVPVMAQYIVLRDEREAWLRFRGAVLVPIDGVDFKPYIEVLLRSHRGARIADRVVVVTDADPNVPGNRKEDLETLASNLGSRGNLNVYTNRRMLEYELCVEENVSLLRNAFLALHPKSGTDWHDRIESASPEVRGEAFLNLLHDKETRKGDFAQQIALRIARRAPFKVPVYLQDAITAISAK
jgi:putative ATP-dependent endonuclease of OLD family